MYKGAGINLWFVVSAISPSDCRVTAPNRYRPSAPNTTGENASSPPAAIPEGLAHRQNILAAIREREFRVSRGFNAYLTANQRIRQDRVTGAGVDQDVDLYLRSAVAVTNVNVFPKGTHASSLSYQSSLVIFSCRFSSSLCWARGSQPAADDQPLPDELTFSLVDRLLQFKIVVSPDGVVWIAATMPIRPAQWFN